MTETTPELSDAEHGAATGAELEPVPDAPAAAEEPLRPPTPSEWLEWFDALEPDKRLEMAGAIIMNSEIAQDCLVENHRGIIVELRALLGTILSAQWRLADDVALVLPHVKIRSGLIGVKSEGVDRQTVSRIEALIANMNEARPKE